MTNRIARFAPEPRRKVSRVAREALPASAMASIG